jgi:hypothetical protein
MKCMLAILITLTFALQSEARIIPSWPYQKLHDQADVVAIVGVKSVAKSEEKMPGHRSPDRFEARIAQLAVGVVLKGEADLKAIDLLHFAYTEMVEPNGANFISFSDSKKHQYLVFLKKDKMGRLVPVTGHYDAAISVKKIARDHYSPIAHRK